MITDKTAYAYNEDMKVSGLTSGKPIWFNVPSNVGARWAYSLPTKPTSTSKTIQMLSPTISMTPYGGASGTKLFSEIASQGVVLTCNALVSTKVAVSSSSVINDKLLLTYGNNSMGNYSPCGGSRLILGKIATPLLNTTTINTSTATINTSPSYGQKNAGTYAKYHNVNCTKTVTINCSLNLSRVTLGTPACLYLVPMNKNGDGSVYKTTSFPELKTALGTDYTNARNEWGFGYNDAQGFGTGSSVEIDCIEATACSFAATLHGKGSTGYDKAGVWCSVHNSKTPIDQTPFGGSNCSLTVINNTIADLPKGKTIYGYGNKTVLLLTYGPSAKFVINTLIPFQVNSVITPSSTTLTMVVTITQNTNSLILTVQSAGFPSTENLSAMNVVVSYWAQSPSTLTPTNSTADIKANTTWWLDGYIGTDMRGWGRVNAQATNATNTISQITELNAIYKIYDKYSIPVQYYINTFDKVNAAKYNPSVFIMGNLSISDGTSGSSAVLYGWIQDLMYRGISNGQSETNWTGRYNSGYGVCYKSSNDMTLPNTFLPTPTMTAPPSAYNTYQSNGEYYKGNYNFGEKVGMNPVMNKEVYGYTKGTTDVAYTYTNYKEMAKYGLNFFDAPGIKINNSQFS